MNTKIELDQAYERLATVHKFEYELEDRMRAGCKSVYDKNNDKLDLSAKNIEIRTRELAAEIAKDETFTNFVLVAVLDGAMPFAEALRKELQALKVPFQYSTIQAKSYIGTVSGELTIQTDSKVPLAGKKVLLAEDVWDLGKTLDGISKKAESQHATEIRHAILVNKEPKEPRKFKQYRNYIGFTLPWNAFIVGHGLDFEGMLRNEDSITVVDENTLPNDLEWQLLNSKPEIIEEIDRLTKLLEKEQNMVTNSGMEKGMDASDSPPYANNAGLLLWNNNQTPPTLPVTTSVNQPGFI